MCTKCLETKIVTAIVDQTGVVPNYHAIGEKLAESLESSGIEVLVVGDTVENFDGAVHLLSLSLTGFDVQSFASVEFLGCYEDAVVPFVIHTAYNDESVAFIIE